MTPSLRRPRIQLISGIILALTSCWCFTVLCLLSFIEFFKDYFFVVLESRAAELDPEATMSHAFTNLILFTSSQTSAALIYACLQSNPSVKRIEALDKVVCCLCAGHIQRLHKAEPSPGAPASLLLERSAV